MRYEVEMSIELIVDADSEETAEHKARRFLNNPSGVVGIVDCSTWMPHIAEIDDTDEA